MEVAYILVPIFAFVLVKRILDHRADARADNVRLLEEALKNPALDRATIEALTHQLTGRRPLRGGGTPAWLTFVLSVGWIALFVGVGIAVYGGVDGDADATLGGVITALAGFGLVTWPFALRELEARRQPQ